MNTNIPEMIDMLFDLEGGILPATHPFLIWDELLRLAPSLAEDKYIGVLPLRSTSSKGDLLLSKRAKLALRMPIKLAEPVASRLSGSMMQIGTHSLKLGKYKSRDMLPYPTIHAQHVTGDDDEVVFMDDIRAQLEGMKITAKLICGKSGFIGDDQQSLKGYSLVVHDLKPEASLQLQYAGLGENRKYGCGIFIPYKVISGLNDD